VNLRWFLLLRLQHLDAYIVDQMLSQNFLKKKVWSMHNGIIYTKSSWLGCLLITSLSCKYFPFYKACLVYIKIKQHVKRKWNFIKHIHDDINHFGPLPLINKYFCSTCLNCQTPTRVEYWNTPNSKVRYPYIAFYFWYA
jgi:hypothetical protein